MKCKNRIIGLTKSIFARLRMIIIIKRPYCMLSLTSKKIACESANLVKTQNETTTYFYLAEKTRGNCFHQA